MNQIRTKANLQNNLEKLRKQAKNRQEQTVNTN
jgi:hypothetical protein